MNKASDNGHLVELRGLRFRYPGAEQWALDVVDLTLAPGEFVLLTGDTGCGKSTLLHCLQGLVPGEIPGDVEGESDLPASADGTSFAGLVFQNFEDQIIAERVEDEVAFGLDQLGIDGEERERRLNEALALAGLAEFRQRSVRALSGGQRQRLAVAGILAMRPALLLLDEPLSQIDQRAAQSLLALLDKLRQERDMTIVLAEHRLEHASPLATRRLHMENGRLREFVSDEKNPESKTQSSLPSLSPSADVVLEVPEMCFAHKDATEPVLDGFSLSVLRREAIALVGPNGSGKSTLLHLLAGLLVPQGANFGWAGNSLRDVQRHDSFHTGLLLQNPDLMLFEETVAREIEFGARRSGASEDEVHRRAKSLAKVFSLGDALDRPPLALSRGQRLRVALASILAFQPRLLLLDEPTTGQDAAGVEAMMTYLHSLGWWDVLIFCTHEREVAARFAHRVIDMGEAVHQ